METKKIQEILSEIQQKIKVPKAQFNAFGKYKFRSCEDTLLALKPILKEYSCAVALTDELVAIPSKVCIMQEGKIPVFGEETRHYIKSTATLIFSGGGELSCEAYAREPVKRVGMDDAQTSGASGSYARKYALNGLFALDSSELDPDDQRNHPDANKGKGNPSQRPPASNPCPTAPISPPPAAVAVNRKPELLQRLKGTLAELSGAMTADEKRALMEDVTGKKTWQAVASMTESEIEKILGNIN